MGSAQPQSPHSRASAGQNRWLSTSLLRETRLARPGDYQPRPSSAQKRSLSSHHLCMVPRAKRFAYRVRNSRESVLSLPSALPLPQHQLPGLLLDQRHLFEHLVLELRYCRLLILPRPSPLDHRQAVRAPVPPTGGIRPVALLATDLEALGQLRDPGSDRYPRTLPGIVEREVGDARRPPQRLQTSGSAWYTFEINRAQFGEQSREVDATAGCSLHTVRRAHGDLPPRIL